MSDFLTVEAASRSDMGKGASRRLRRENKIPGILYGAGKDAVNLELVHSEMLKHLAHEEFFSSILTLNLDGKSERVILRDLQRHPFRPEVLHMDFQRVDENRPLTIHVPIHFANQAKSPGAKAGGGFRHVMIDIEVKCLPKDIPEHITVDLGAMEVGDTLMLSDIELPENVSSVVLSRGMSHNAAVVVCTKSKK